ncbi:hypothetical protein PEL8287_02433 [Roseovarius litorisediminis]|uniref:Uncharacterized protein n=1 Tax=Roseovarius litorisediminis TaxID=1312363 RepID=A0A1Y5STZ5_9RHOB|nr:hypothetical protein [Roseovarius litorisediminis]SLN46892.1 hypothetical protein PEL8287_02433 [Roseovarius litorisediminis]
MIVGSIVLAIITAAISAMLALLNGASLGMAFLAYVLSGVSTLVASVVVCWVVSLLHIEHWVKSYDLTD